MRRCNILKRAAFVFSALGTIQHTLCQPPLPVPTVSKNNHNKAFTLLLQKKKKKIRLNLLETSGWPLNRSKGPLSNLNSLVMKKLKPVDHAKKVS